MRNERAMIELTEEQQQELDGVKPVRARYPRTNDTYVLVPADGVCPAKSVVTLAGDNQPPSSGLPPPASRPPPLIFGSVR
jgi:hypothetical protein